MAGYSHKGLDLSAIFEPLLSGDPQHPEDTGYAVQDLDLRHLYVPLSQGARYAELVGAAHIGTDLRDIFAARGSVPRFLQPLPWDRTVTPNPVPEVYHQPSRALKTKVVVRCKVLEDGRVEIVLRAPNIHGQPDVYNDTLVYTLQSPPAWNHNDTPAGVNFQIRFDVTGGNHFSIRSPSIQFGEWGDLGEGVVEGTLVFTHNSGSMGLKNSNGGIRISVRRSDYPGTNKTDAVLTTNIKLNVLASLFSNPSSYAKTFEYQDLIANYHNPDMVNTIYTVLTKVTIGKDGTLLIASRDTDGAWHQQLSTRWRRSDIPVSDTDFDVRCAAIGGSVGMVSNPIVGWSQVSADKTVQMTHQISSNQLPNTYGQSAQLRFEFRQRSTRGWSQDGVALADNSEQGTMEIISRIQLLPPLPLPWPDPSVWDGVHTSAVQADWQPESTGSLTTTLEARLSADGLIKIYRDGTLISSGSWLPAGRPASQIEVRATLASTGTATSNVRNDLSAWKTIGTTQYIRLVVSRSHSSGVGSVYRLFSGALEFRRKNWPSDLVSVPWGLRGEVRLNTAPLLPWDFSDWAKTWSGLERVLWEPESRTKNESVTVDLLLRADGVVVISREGAVLKTGRWLPAGVSAQHVEAYATQNITVGGPQASGSTQRNDIGSWTTLNSNKTLSVTVVRSHTSEIGTSQRNAANVITFRRKANPVDKAEANITLSAVSEMTTPNKWNWMWDRPWAQHTLNISEPLDPGNIGGAVLGDWLTMVFKGDGKTYLYNGAGTLLAVGNWRSASMASDTIQMKAVLNTATNLNSSSNGIPDWSMLHSGQNDLVVKMQVIRRHTSGQGTTTGVYAGYIDFRRRYWQSDAVRVAVSLTINATIEPPLLTLYPPGDFTQWARTYTNLTEYEMPYYVPDVQTVTYTAGKREVSNWDNYGLFNASTGAFLWYRDTIGVVRTWKFFEIFGAERNGAWEGVIAFGQYATGEYNKGPKQFTAKFTDGAGRTFTGTWYYKENITNHGRASYHLDNRYAEGWANGQKFFQFTYQAWLLSNKTMKVEISNLVM